MNWDDIRVCQVGICRRKYDGKEFMVSCYCNIATGPGLRLDEKSIRDCVFEGADKVEFSRAQWTERTKCFTDLDMSVSDFIIAKDYFDLIKIFTREEYEEYIK